MQITIHFLNNNNLVKLNGHAPKQTEGYEENGRQSSPVKVTPVKLDPKFRDSAPSKRTKSMDER